MRCPPLLFALSILAGTAGAQTAQANILVSIDKTTQSMTVSRDGETLHRWPVSTGRRGYDTPNGTFRAFRMEKDHYSKEWDDAPMPHSIFFTKVGHALHGYLDTKNIGRPASHGCVRLRPENAATLYALVEEDGVLNTTVAISGAIPSSAPAMARRSGPGETPPQNETARAPLPVAPDGRAYTPQDPNYPRQYGWRQDWQQQQQQQGYGQPRYVDPRYPQPLYVEPNDPLPRYVDPYAPRHDRTPRYGQRDDPRYAGDDEEDAPVTVQPRRTFRPVFPFGN